MFIGRAGLMAYYARKRFNIEKGRPKHQYLIDHQDTFKKLQHKNKNKKNTGIIFYTNTPVAAWFLGLMFIVAGIFLLYILQTGMLEHEEGFIIIIWEDKSNSKEMLHKEAFDENKNNYNTPRAKIEEEEYLKEKISYWWRYLMIFFVILMGVLFLVNVDRETVEIHKEYKLLVMNKSNPWLCCRKRSLVRDLECLTDVGVVKRGHASSKGNSTVYYAIEFRYGVFDENTKNDAARREEIMEFSDQREAKKKYVEVMTFIERNMDLSKIRIQDESTTNLTRETPLVKKK